VAVFFNTILAKKLPMIEGIFVFCHIIGILIFIPLWILIPRRVGGSPLITFFNPNGWSSNGVATWAGINAPTTALIGFDCSVHMGKLIFLNFIMLFLT
jgi:choline transport protein